MRSFLTITAVCVGLAALTPAYAGDKVWISLGDAALVQLQKHRPSARAVASVKADAAQDASALSVAAKPEGIHLVEVDEDALASLSHSIHEELRRCGGYMYHPSQEAGLAALRATARRAPRSGWRPRWSRRGRTTRSTSRPS